MTRNEAKQLTEQAEAEYQAKLQAVLDTVKEKCFQLIRNRANARSTQLYFDVTEHLPLDLKKDYTFVDDLRKKFKVTLASPSHSFTISNLNCDGCFTISWS